MKQDKNYYGIHVKQSNNNNKQKGLKLGKISIATW